MYKRVINRFGCFILTLLMLLPMISNAEDLTTDEAYWENIELLSIYMRADPDATVDIVALRTNFQNLHHYQLSTEFSLYAQILEYLEQDDFNNAASWLSVLQLYPEFDKYVVGEEFNAKYPEIRGLTEMETYINGRREEAAFNYSVASTYYKSCLKFFDAMNRYRSLYVDLDVVVAETLDQIKNGDYSNALKNAEYLIENNHERGQALYDVAKAQLEAAKATPRPTNTPMPTPSPTPAITPVETKSVNPQWSAWSEWNTTAIEKNSTTEVEEKIQYRSRAIYRNQNYSNWSSWGNWSTTAASESATRDVETKTEYRYRDTTSQTQYSDWGSWSDWSTTAVTDTTLRDVETKTEENVTYTYSYKHWHYKHSENGWQNSYAEYKGSKYVEGSGKWEYKTTTSPLPQDGTKDGHARYRSGGVSWYYQTKKEKVETVTYYRYRTRTEQQVQVTGSWSSWSSAAATATATREVQAQTLYRSRTRELVTATTFGKWSDWSDKWIGENSERDVETRKVYRYRKLQ